MKMLDEDTSLEDMIEILHMYCPCGQCHGVLLTLHEAMILVDYLKSTMVEPT